MGPFSMTVLIVLIVSIAKVMNSRYRAMGHGHGHGQALGEAESRRDRDELRALRERVAVLERVVTDGRSGSDLDREIERLRDRREQA